jgi:hypothetical protein
MIMMLLYEYRVRQEFERLKTYAQAVREKFEASATTEDLLRDTENLSIIYTRLVEKLPPEVSKRTNLPRHLAWMKKWLGEGNPSGCTVDIRDICVFDIPELEEQFIAWHSRGVHFDTELRQGIEDLILNRQYDSAVRRGFVILIPIAVGRVVIAARH